MIIKHDNIIYMPTISPLGGIETYVYELVKKYHDLDLAVVSKTIDPEQRLRIEKYCPVYIHVDQKIECKVAIINYDQSIIDFINKEAKIYQTMHADYSSDIYKQKPKPHPRVTEYIAITKYLQGKMKDILAVDNVRMCYNPLTINKEKPLVLVTASRLHPAKGTELMQKLINEMDKQRLNYIWIIITNDIGVVNSKNIIWVKNRLDVDKFIAIADYGVLLSKSEACSYFINECLYRNKPMLVTPLPYLKEIGVKDNKNSYIINFDGSNIKEVVAKLDKIPEFEFKELKDGYDKIFTKTKTKYKKNIEDRVIVRCIQDYDDMQMMTRIKADSEFVVDKKRADVLVKAKVCVIKKQ